MHDTILSLIRTWVPVGVGAVLAWVATNWDIGVPDDASSSLVVGVTALAIALYYGVVRLLERRFPWFGVMLGAKREPEYASSATLPAARQVGRPGREGGRF